nr:dTDP-4-dehydrorhamnose 3,5-epimerase [Nocardia sp. BMG111209]
MVIEQADLADVLVLTPQPFRDDRGVFTSTFDADELDAHLGVPGVAAGFVQDFQCRSVQGVIRGLHGRSRRSEAKLVRCARGSVYDVLVDIRPGSPTFGVHEAFLLDDNDFRHLYIPPGFLHGFQTLSEVADVCYRTDRPHNPREDLAVAYDDPQLAIEWPEPVTVVSPGDRAAGSWSDLLVTLGAETPGRPPCQKS